MSSATASKCWGLLSRRPRWGLSWRGWLFGGGVFLLTGWGLAWNIHPFLAVTRRVPGKVLVVEGWMNRFGVGGAMQEFKTGGYDRVLTTGGPSAGYGPKSSFYDTEAWQSAGLLRKAGLAAEAVQAVPSLFVGKDRTYNSALALRDWLRDHDPQIRSLNVLTEDAHARRTWLLFQEALGPEVQVGIISVPNPDYDARHWWRSSEGVREVIDETIAYLYAKCLFWPGNPKAEIR